MREALVAAAQRALYHLPVHPERARAAELRALREMARWPRDRLRAEQWRRLQALCASAASLPFHARRMREAGWSGPAPRDADEFARLPLLGPADLREHGDALRAPGRRGVPHRIATSGSSGRPRTVLLDAATLAGRAAANTLLDEWAGYRIGCRAAILWGDGVASNGGRARRRSRLRTVFDAVLAPHTALWLPVADLPSDTLADYCRRLAAFRPDVIVSYAGTLEVVARRLAAGGLPAVRPRTVISSAEPLGARRRALVEGVFGCPVFDRYGAREVGVIAAECTRHDGLHVNAAHLYLEIVDDDGRPLPPGQTGRVVVTDLRNREMPLVRYLLGDLAAALDAPCACGLELPRITPVAGRLTDVLLCPSGRVLTEVPFERAFEAAGGVEQFRLLQPERDRLRIEIVAPHLSAARLAALRETFTGWLGAEMRVEVAPVAHIAPTAGGKYPIIDSPVARAAFG